MRPMLREPVVAPLYPERQPRRPLPPLLGLTPRLSIAQIRLLTRRKQQPKVSQYVTGGKRPHTLLQTEPMLNIQRRNTKAALKKLVLKRPVITLPPLLARRIGTLPPLPLRARPVPPPERRPQTRNGVRRAHSLGRPPTPAPFAPPPRRTPQQNSVAPPPPPLKPHETLSQPNVPTRLRPARRPETPQILRPPTRGEPSPKPQIGALRLLPLPPQIVLTPRPETAPLLPLPRLTRKPRPLALLQAAVILLPPQTVRLPPERLMLPLTVEQKVRRLIVPLNTRRHALEPEKRLPLPPLIAVPPPQPATPKRAKPEM